MFYPFKVVLEVGMELKTLLGTSAAEGFVMHRGRVLFNSSRETLRVYWYHGPVGVHI